MIFVTFLFGRLIFQIFILVVYGLPKLFDMFEDKNNLNVFKVLVLVMMFMAITVSCLMNIFWMYLIIAQIRRILTRQPATDLEVESASDAQSQADVVGGSEPNDYDDK